MRILGISGAFDSEDAAYLADLPPRFFHDAAAALVVDGAVVAAVEEERLNREKHSNRFPRRAIEACLSMADVKLSEVDRVAYFFDEPFTDEQIAAECAGRDGAEPAGIRELVAGHLSRIGPEVVRPDRIAFQPHHRAHAASALRFHAGPSLVLVMDGNGEAESTSIFRHDGTDTTLLSSYPVADSLGHFYTELTAFLGFGDFDEYKVMGLAAYGDPEPAAKALRSVAEFAAEGRFTLDRTNLAAALESAGYRRRTPGAAIEPAHADVAAAGQRLLEDTILHLTRHWRAVTGLDTLCVTGGVAQNTSANGRLLRDGGFARVVVDPAGHDGGAAVGAALAESGPPRKPAQRVHLYLGPDLGPHARIERRLAEWADLITVETPDDLAGTVADLLAAGEIAGWVQGRSEFGPRALGNRSILADPRPAANRDRVNALIKERESFRPLAPAVLAGAEHDWFVIPDVAADLRFMGFVVPVRSDVRDRLGAVSHVDGTARVQVVDSRDNPAFAGLLTAFAARTGVPILLNTSFNTNAEPIVQTLDDALACLLTSQLDALAAGPFLIRRRSGDDLAERALRTMSVTPHPLCEVGVAPGGGPQVGRRGRAKWSMPVSEATARLLGTPAGGERPSADECLTDLLELWRRRLIRVAPERTGATDE